MDVSQTATIGRSHRGLDSIRDIQAMLAQTSFEDDDTKEASSASSSDIEDIDSETAMNTVYNLLTELGDLNRSNRRTAELLAEKFSVLQAQVSRAESLNSDEASQQQGTCAESVISLPRGPPDSVSQTGSPRSESTFHTPPNTIGSTQSVRLESPAFVPRSITPILTEGYMQTDMTSSHIAELKSSALKLEEENQMLRQNIKMLVQSVREQQEMAKEYEATLARSLKALRLAAFDSHLQISEVQDKYRELLASEVSLNRKLQSENSDLKHALNSAAAAIKSTLADDSDSCSLSDNVSDT
ncbi:hypothetical protein IWW36_002667 [Coemansia brasiliensis]|uniref:Uncharacterized protein n=1 Tax=Coemansia brasiliensis TaxID=2650707 RepID=A0A9W8LXX3_9FUNG|nr:hypothetical protein IWW36_002667 [Coemansia brasiliensis]